MKKNLFTTMLLVACLCFLPAIGLAANKKKVVTNPTDAKIYVDGNYVADGSLFLKFNARNDMYVIKVESPGYVTKEVKLFKSDSRNVIAIDLRKDDALDGSVESDIANNYFTINVREDVDEATAWKILSQILLNYFDEMKTSDKAAGFMTTPWVEQKFPRAEVRIRTMVQIRQIISDQLTYQIRISSEISPLNIRGDHAFKPWTRVLKHYTPIINEIQQRLGEK